MTDDSVPNVAVGDRPFATFSAGGQDYARCDVRASIGDDRYRRLPLSLRILAENILRKEPDARRALECVTAIAEFRTDVDLPFRPERVVLQDMLGTAALVDLAGLRDEVADAGGVATDVNPAVTTHLVVDHSLNVDVWRTPDARKRNEAIERSRNEERFRFLDWATKAFDNLTIIGSGNGILHQINLERLTPVISAPEASGIRLARPDTLVGTDSHTPMINAIGVLGWGVGGLEAEVAMLGKPLIMRLPEVVEVRLNGHLAPGVLATDLVLTLTERLRAFDVVGAILEFTGPGVQRLTLADRATVSNMAPEYGATAALFPIDDHTLDYMRVSGRGQEGVALASAYAREQGLWHDQLAEAVYSRSMAFDLAGVERSIAGPRQPHDRIAVVGKPDAGATPARPDAQRFPPKPVVIAAITSCTNTSNPRSVITAALLARNARRHGLTTPDWIRTSFAPGSRVVQEYLAAAGLQKPLDELGFNVIGLGCTTCNGLSGPLLDADLKARLAAEDAITVGVTSGNRNFEGRVHPDAREVYIMSPALVVAYALSGSGDGDIAGRPLGFDTGGQPIYLSDVWPSDDEVAAIESAYVDAGAFARGYREIDAKLAGRNRDDRGGAVPSRFGWDPDSTYIRRPPHCSLAANATPSAMAGLRPLVILGDHITTDHISPTGNILAHSDTGKYLLARGVSQAEFNAYGARRGNHEAAQGATFASPRLRNEMLPDGAEGPITLVQPDGEQKSIFQAAQAYAGRGVGLIVIAGGNYGSGSSRDWAAKGPRLLGVRAVVAESFERIHRQNLAAMGILPLQFDPGTTRKTLRLDGTETFDVVGLDQPFHPQQRLILRVNRADGRFVETPVLSRLDTSEDVAYFRNGGLLPQLKTELVLGSGQVEEAGDPAMERVHG